MLARSRASQQDGAIHTLCASMIVSICSSGRRVNILKYRPMSASDDLRKNCRYSARQCQTLMKVDKTSFVRFTMLT